MVGMLVALLLFLGGVPLAVRIAAGNGGVSAKGDLSLAVESESTYQDLAHAADLLEAGSDASAKQLIDNNRDEALIVNPGGHGSGALSSFSPTTLLMHLGKVMTDHAVAVAARGDRQDAFAWLERCRTLSGQVLATPAPSLAALQVSRYLDRTAGEAEVSVLAKVGEHARAAVVATREKALDSYWRSVMLSRISSQRSQWSLREWSKTSVRLSPETRDQEERRFALDLMQVYQRERVQERVS
jgi:hypothetical protein